MKTARRNVVVIGSSAGGVAALQSLVAGLPADLPATVLVVQHLSPTSPRLLADILDRAGQLPAGFASDGEPVRESTVRIAPPDQHLLLREDRLQVVRGPRENRSRPSIDVLFRSAACVAGPRVVGIVLTGSLDDGTAGLAAIRRCGGVTVVQDPREALWPDMPENALARGVVDHVARLDEIPSLLERLLTEPIEARHEPPPVDLELECRMAALEIQGVAFTEAMGGRAAGYSCPDCAGPLWEIVNRDQAGPVRFRCHQGHALTASSLLAGTDDTIERALWTALRTYEERARLQRSMGEKSRERGNESIARLWADRAHENEQDAARLRGLIATDHPSEDDSTPRSPFLAGRSAPAPAAKLSESR